MFCTRCGKELSDDVSFCPNCGVKVLKHESDPDEDVTLETEPLAETTHNKSKENLEIAQIVGKNAEYYLAEFQKIESHQKPRFNWAAFLLNIAFCFYRKCGFLFKKYFLIPCMDSNLICLGFASSVIVYSWLNRFNASFRLCTAIASISPKPTTVRIKIFQGGTVFFLFFISILQRFSYLKSPFFFGFSPSGSIPFIRSS